MRVVTPGSFGATLHVAEFPHAFFAPSPHYMRFPGENNAENSFIFRTGLLWLPSCNCGESYVRTAGDSSPGGGGKNRMLAPLSKVRKVSAAYHFIIFLPPRETEKKYYFRTRKSDIQKKLAISPHTHPQFRKPIFCPPLVALVPSMYVLHPTLYSSPFLALKAKLPPPPIFFWGGGEAELRVACKRRRSFFRRGGGGLKVFGRKSSRQHFGERKSPNICRLKTTRFYTQIISANLN